MGRHGGEREMVDKKMPYITGPNKYQESGAVVSDILT